MNDYMLTRALNYAKSDFPVFPCCYPDSDSKCGCGRGHQDRDVGKVPLTQNGLTDATIEQSRVIDYWTRHPQANIGIAIPPGYFVLDVDIGHNGYESLEKLQDEVGLLPKTLQIITGSGGSHFWYNTDREIRNTAKLGGYEGLDIRGLGGYVIAPPSVHKSGNIYEKSPIWSGPIVIAPDTLIELCTKKISGMATTSTSDSPLFEGERNDSMARDAGSMRRRGFSEEAILAALLITNRDKCQPPLDEDEVRNIAKSINRYQPENTIHGYSRRHKDVI